MGEINAVDGKETKNMEENEQLEQQENSVGENNTEGNSVKTDAQRLDEILNADGKLQGEFDRRVQKALETARGKWQLSLEEEQDEAKKLEKMTQNQRDRYFLDKEKNEFEAEKKAFKAQQMKLATGSELAKRGFDPDFADFLTADTAEKTNANIENFEKAFNIAVQKYTNEKMRGDKPPKENENSDKDSDDAFLKGFTAKI